MINYFEHNLKTKKSKTVLEAVRGFVWMKKSEKASPAVEKRRSET